MASPLDILNQVNQNATDNLNAALAAARGPTFASTVQTATRIRPAALIPQLQLSKTLPLPPQIVPDTDTAAASSTPTTSAISPWILGAIAAVVAAAGGFFFLKKKGRI